MLLQGAFWGLMGGMSLGSVRLILEMVYTEPHCGEPDVRPVYIAKLHYMYVAVILFVVSAVIVVVLSLLTQPPTKEMVNKLNTQVNKAKC